MARKKRKPVIFTGKKGQKVRLLNPAEKGAKFATELKLNKGLTNFGEVKKEYLTKEQRAFRAGYLESRKDCAKAHNHNKKKRQSRKNNSRAVIVVG